jgi:hypothetical protein
MAYAREPITAGETASGQQIFAADSGSILRNPVPGVIGTGIDNMDIKDYEVLVNLYRYQMQLSVLSDSDADSETDDLFAGLSGLV